MPIEYRDNIQNIIELAKQASSGAKHVFFADIAKWLQNQLGCFIFLVPSLDHEFAGQAQTFTRVIRVQVTWSDGLDEYSHNAYEHTVFFDKNLPQAEAARLTGHELYHIWKNNLANPHLNRDEETGLIDYGEEIEKIADAFSLALLKNHSYKSDWTPPTTVKGFIDFLDNEAGWPDWLTPDEVHALVEKLYATQ